MDQQTPPPPGGYQPPPPPPPPPQYGAYTPPPSGGGSSAAGRVAGPAIALMILSVISITLLGIRMVAQLIAPEFFNSFASQENPQIAAFAQKFGMIVCICAIVMNIFVLVGAMKMKNLQNYTLAIVATILVMLPCNCPCCILGLPIGIWSLIVLLNSDVKAAFPS